MDPMDFTMESDNHNYIQQQNALQSRCPRIMPADASSQNFRGSGPPIYHPNIQQFAVPFSSNPNQPHPQWDPMTQTNIYHPPVANYNFGTTYNPHQAQGQVPELTTFNSSYLGLASHLPPRPQQSAEANRLGVMRRSSLPDPAQQSNYTASGEDRLVNQGNGPSPVVSAGQTLSNYDDGNRRNETHNAVSQPQYPTNSQRTLPPPVNDPFLRQQYPFYNHTHAPPERSLSFAPQTSPPRLFTRSFGSSRHAPAARSAAALIPPVWPPEDADRIPTHFDGDSDDDSSLDNLYESPHREEIRAPYVDRVYVEREGTGRRPYDTLRRSAVSVESDTPDYVERARAIRRAAATQTKLVASSSALAALEKVDLASIKEDDRFCIICYNEFEVKNPEGQIESAVRLPKCKHVFGDNCLKQWLKDSDSCPYCRDKLPSEPRRNIPPDDIRRMWVQRQHAGDPNSFPWASEVGTDRTSYLAAMERAHRYNSFMQNSLTRDEARNSEEAAAIRRFQPDWAAFQSLPTSAAQIRPGPELDSRRRFRRGPHRATGSTSSRSSRNSTSQVPGVLRTPSHGNPLPFEETTSPQRRSVTPHPTIVSPSTFSNQTHGHPITSGRPSSLPTNTSPLRVASIIPPHPFLHGSPPENGPCPIPTSNPTRPTSEIRDGFGNATGWNMSVPNSGRPISASYRGDRSLAHLQQFGGNMEGYVPSRLAPYVSPSQQDSNVPGGFLGRHRPSG